MNRATLLLASLLAAGCNPTMSLRTAAPPTTTIVWDGLDHRIALTEGVAVGFDVWCAWGPCKDVRTVTEAPAIAQVYTAHLGTRTQAWGPRTAPAFALVGVAPGRTLLHVSEGTHVSTLTVTVLPAKPVGAAATPPP